jgi:hypothetical protein
MVWIEQSEEGRGCSTELERRLGIAISVDTLAGTCKHHRPRLGVFDAALGATRRVVSARREEVSTAITLR